MNFKIKRIGIKFLCDTKIDEKKNIYCVSIEWYKFIFNFTISEAHFISFQILFFHIFENIFSLNF